jgi:hypothetical protein
MNLQAKQYEDLCGAHDWDEKEIHYGQNTGMAVVEVRSPRDPLASI